MFWHYQRQDRENVPTFYDEVQYSTEDAFDELSDFAKRMDLTSGFVAKVKDLLDEDGDLSVYEALELVIENILHEADQVQILWVISKFTLSVIEI